jgi:hypothetical protein
VASGSNAEEEFALVDGKCAIGIADGGLVAAD